MDKDFGVVYSRDLMLSGNGETLEFESIRQVGKSIVLITSKNDSDNKIDALYGQVLNLATGEFNAPILIHGQGYEKKPVKIRYSIHESPNQDFLLLTTITFANGATSDPLGFNKAKGELLHFHVFGEEMEKAWELKDFETKHWARSYDIDQIAIGNEGEVYLLGTRFDDSDYTNRSKLLYSKIHELVILDERGEKVGDEMHLDQKFMYSDGIKVAHDGTIYVAGYWRNDADKQDGIFQFILDPGSGEILQKDEGILDEKYVELKTNRFGGLEGDFAEPSRLKLENIIVHNDGTTSIVGRIWETGFNEEYRTSTAYYGDFLSSRIKDDRKMVHTRYYKESPREGINITFSLNNKLFIIHPDYRKKIARSNWEELTKKEKKALEGFALFILEFTEAGIAYEKGLVDYRNETSQTWREHKRIRKECFLIQKKDRTELLLSTFLGEKKYGVVRLQFNS